MEAWVPVFVAVVMILPATIAAIIGARNAKQTNDAVNHRHEKGTPRLYDLALENHQKVDEILEWKRGYEKSPWNDGDKTVAWLKAHKDQHDRLEDTLSELKGRPPCRMHDDEMKKLK